MTKGLHPHENLRRIANSLKEAVEGGDVDLIYMRANMFYGALAEHIANEEAQEGFFDKIETTKPRLVTRVKEMRAQHSTLLGTLGQVISKRGQSLGDLRERISAKLRGRNSVEPFRYRNKGNLATIGRSKAVAEIGSIHLTGGLAWLVWVVVHIFYLIGFRNRFMVLADWAWSYFTFQRGSRVIPDRDGTD